MDVQVLLQPSSTSLASLGTQQSTSKALSLHGELSCARRKRGEKETLSHVSTSPRAECWGSGTCSGSHPTWAIQEPPKLTLQGLGHHVWLVSLWRSLLQMVNSLSTEGLVCDRSQLIQCRSVEKEAAMTQLGGNLLQVPHQPTEDFWNTSDGKCLLTWWSLGN